MSGLILVNFSIIYILEKSYESSGSILRYSFTEHVDVATRDPKQLVEACAKRVDSSCKYVLGDLLLQNKLVYYPLRHLAKKFQKHLTRNPYR